MNVNEKLMIVQSKLKAPKGQENKFGHYKYRSCEDILEAVKPLLNEVGAILTLTDEIELIGDRTYITAVANFTDIEKGEKVHVSASAREDETKKGMDLAQITGSVSSYARKYALNGLFCIDDTKDADSADNRDNKNPEPQLEPDKAPDKLKVGADPVITKEQQLVFFKITKNVALAKKVLQKHKYTSSSQVKTSEYQTICEELKAAAIA